MEKQVKPLKTKQNQFNAMRKAINCIHTPNCSKCKNHGRTHTHTHTRTSLYPWIRIAYTPPIALYYIIRVALHSLPFLQILFALNSDGASFSFVAPDSGLVDAFCFPFHFKSPLRPGTFSFFC